VKVQEVVYQTAISDTDRYIEYESQRLHHLPLYLLWRIALDETPSMWGATDDPLGDPIPIAFVAQCHRCNIARSVQIAKQYQNL
jgi:hypothetical protein